jgi:hypothetical protein
MNELKEIIYNLEASLLTQEVRSSFEKLNKLMTDDFIEYGSSGLIYNKKDILERLPNKPSPSYSLSNFELIIISESVVQTRFKTRRINLDGSELSSLHSSLWRKSNSDWQMFFHQGTPTN